ncbi:2,3-bisphosphoglycerate-dependent phosphoglycerate mutase [Neorhizobium sp. R1-B]|uniref:2,3-bisphosphoglycerate-dependent phosphoglycerate mutase n=1 Tax=Neorhizobium sp. R1-B TaxID=2485162 RepID=UPI001416F1A4|nr:2,3-bisphosphoglycerate-dependent phosphoglycerate mutase [Neorhizobium sp. R1-B]
MVLVRHGQSEGNAAGIFTGWNDPGLSRRGFIEAECAARVIGNTRFDIAFTSCLTRAQETLRQILNEIGQNNVRTIQSANLNERHYGELTGITKQEARSLWGKDRVKAWQRSYVSAPPGGESLRDTLARVVPYYITAILPHLLRGENTIVVAHGNSLRALIMALEGIDRHRIATIDIPTSSVFSYQMNADGRSKKGYRCGWDI